MNVKLRQLEIINETIIYLLFFTTPLVFVFVTRELFEFPKMILVYFFSIILCGLLIIQKSPRLMKPKASLKPFLVFLTSVGISTLFSINRYTSIFGYYSRFNGGLLSMLAVGVILTFATYLLNRRTTTSAINAIMISGGLVSLYALLQNFGIDKNFWVQDSQARAFSTLGQPNWLAAYLLITLPIPLYKYLYAEDLSGKAIFFTLTALYYFAFWSTYSLSGFLGLLAFTLLFLVGSFKTIRVKWAELALLATICVAVAFMRPGIFGAKIKSFLQIVSPTISISRQALAAAQATTPAKTSVPGQKSIDTGDIRLGVWSGALRLWFSSPKNFLIGTGPETFAYAFLPYRQVSLNKTTEWDFLYNKAHNYFLDLLATTGIFGLLSFSLFSIISTSQVLKSGAPPNSLQRFMLYGWATTFVTNFFGWPTVTLSLLFFLYPLLMTRLGHTDVESHSIPDEGTINIPPTRIFLVIPLCLILVLGTVNLFLADVSFTQGYGSSQSGDVEAAESTLKDATRLNPWEPAYHKELAYTYAQKYVETENENDLNSALEEARTAYNLNPRNSLTLRSLIRVYYLISKVKPQYKTDLEKLALEIIGLSPTEPRSYYDAALMFYYSGDRETAKELNDGALKLRPGYPEALELSPKLEITPSPEKK
jgi:O-antigen ligase